MKRARRRLFVAMSCARLHQITDRHGQYVLQVDGIEWLGDVWVEACSQRGSLVLLLPPAGHRHQVDAGPPGFTPDPKRDFVAIDLRKTDVEQDRRRCERACHLQGRGAVVHDGDIVAHDLQ